MTGSSSLTVALALLVAVSGGGCIERYDHYWQGTDIHFSEKDEVEPGDGRLNVGNPDGMAADRGVCADKDCACKPDCSGKDCGADGCGGSCGACSGGKVCLAGNCVCTPEHHQSCSDGKLYWYDWCNVQGSLVNNCDDANVCTTDGCSGSQCTHSNVQNDTPCGNEKSCQSGSCTHKCGDLVCASTPPGTETQCTCPKDCGGCAGCCAGSVCKAGTMTSECGKNGIACMNCAGSGKECTNGECVSAVWKDPTSGLTWQVTPIGGYMNWSSAKTHCTNLSLDGGGWHLPTIGELRTLIRGCPATVEVKGLVQE